MRMMMLTTALAGALAFGLMGCEEAANSATQVDGNVTNAAMTSSDVKGGSCCPDDAEPMMASDQGAEKPSCSAEAVMVGADACSGGACSSEGCDDGNKMVTDATLVSNTSETAACGGCEGKAKSAEAVMASESKSDCGGCTGEGGAEVVLVGAEACSGGSCGSGGCGDSAEKVAKSDCSEASCGEGSCEDKKDKKDKKVAENGADA